MTSNNKVLQKIYVPRPGGADYDDEKGYDHYVLQVIQYGPPEWYRHFDKDELLGRYRPIREIGIFLYI